MNRVERWRKRKQQEWGKLGGGRPRSTTPEFTMTPVETLTWQEAVEAGTLFESQGRERVPYPERAEQMRQYAAAHPDDFITQTDVANALGCHPSTVARVLELFVAKLFGDPASHERHST